MAEELTKWEREFELEVNRFTIKFNDPFTTQAEIAEHVDLCDKITSVTRMGVNEVSAMNS
jgi:hypothetical protein